MKTRKMDEHNIVNSLNQLELRAYHMANEVFDKIKDVLDARVTTFWMLAQVFRSLKIYYILRKEYLSHKEWFEETYIGKWEQRWPIVRTNMIINNDLMQSYTELITKDFDQVMLVAHTQCLFSIIESRFRIFTQALDSKACAEGTAEFYKIRDWLLDRLNKENKDEYKETIYFFQLIRNSIHNNGRHMNKKYPEKPPVYRGRPYSFEYGKPVELMNPDNLFFFELPTDILSMMEDIIKSIEILNIPTIPDPMAP
jgi:hypothetical protein